MIRWIIYALTGARSHNAVRGITQPAVIRLASGILDACSPRKQPWKRKLALPSVQLA